MKQLAVAIRRERIVMIVVPNELNGHQSSGSSQIHRRWAKSNVRTTGIAEISQYMLTSGGLMEPLAANL
jgi:hypothetical protein